MLKRFVLIVLLSGLMGKMSIADELTAAKSGDIRQLINVTSGANIAKQYASASSQLIFQSLKTSRPDLSERALGVIDKELVALFSEKMAAPGGLTEQVIPIYHKYYSHQEI